jgi:hypothetical protein
MAFVLLSAVGVLARERVLVDFSLAEARRALATHGAAISPSAEGIRVETGVDRPWPGITFPAPAGRWDLSPHTHVLVGLRNLEDSELKVFCRVDNPGANGTEHCVTDSITLAPRAKGELRVELTRTVGGTLSGLLFGMRGYPAEPGAKGTLDTSNITQVLLFVSKPARGHSFEVRSIRATGDYAPPTASTTDAAPYLPLIDRFGQYRHRSWPGKVAGEADMARRRDSEARQLAEHPGPADWDAFGGWAAGPRLDRTGYFRVQKHGGRWWLVDPDGRLFWSHGVDCVLSMDYTVVQGRESWFEDPPWDAPGGGRFLAEHMRVLKGHYAGQSPRAFSFAAANLRIKYGEDWRKAVPSVIHQRLRAWGLNTIGNWSDGGLRLMRKTPYTDAVHSEGAREIEGSEGYWGKFPDVFDPGFRESVRRSMRHHEGRSAGDPWCIGFFSDNEMSWGDDTSLAVAALKSPRTQPAKVAFVAFLRNRHATLSELNGAWGTAHSSWEAFAEARDAPSRAGGARADLESFYTQIAETYFRTVREVIREFAPHQLYLGCRFAWANPRAAAAAARHCDVVSYNLYQRTVASYAFAGGADVPLIIGEFHFGALDRGLFHTGLVPTGSQKERAAAYREYVEGALHHPQFVGCHWFQYQDEPTTGRAYDEENYQIGFIDVADTPYPELVAAAQAVGGDLYRLRSRP